MGECVSFSRLRDYGNGSSLQMGDASRLGKKGKSLTARHSVFGLGIVGSALKLRILLISDGLLLPFNFFFLLLPVSFTFGHIPCYIADAVHFSCHAVLTPPTMTWRDWGCRMHVRWDWLGWRANKTQGYFCLSDTEDTAFAVHSSFFFLLIP